MSMGPSAIYAGRVIHKRLRPKPHALNYRVFTFLFDVDDLPATAARLKLFSYNRWNVFSVHDRDHGPGDGTPLGEIARRALRDAHRPADNRRILLLAYPRVLGYVFNPLSVYFVYAPGGALETVIYQVSNTFGERKSYVVPAGDANPSGVYGQRCAKEMFVSPFTEGRGGYLFRITEAANEVVVAVLFSDRDGPLIKTHFRGQHQPLADSQLAKLIVTHPLLTLKVIAAIHYEALKLWLKGIPLTDRHVSPTYSTTPQDTSKLG